MERAAELNIGPIHLSGHRRTHHSDISFGAWKLCVNGIQLFAGRYALTIHWPARWFEWSFSEEQS